MTNQTINGASAIASTYDADGLLATVGGLSLDRHLTNGMLLGTTLGQVNDTYQPNSVYGYNSFGELIDYVAKSGTTNILTLHYERDAGGRITRKAETVGAVATLYTRYEYDAAGFLWRVYQGPTTGTEPLLATYAYDLNGNRTTVNGTTTSYDEQDRLAGVTYTANGELTSKTVGALTTTYSYDVLGNLRSVVLPSGAGTID